MATVATKFAFDPADMARFNRAVDDTIRETGRSIPAIVTSAARTFASRAMASTPMVPRGARVGMPKTVMVDYSSGRRVARMPDPTEFGAPATRGRGYAKGSWAGVLARLGARVSASGDMTRNRAMLMEAEVYRASNGYAIDMASLNPFIEDLDRGRPPLNTAYGIMDAALRSTAHLLEQRLNKMAKRISKRWK